MLEKLVAPTPCFILAINTFKLNPISTLIQMLKKIGQKNAKHKERKQSADRRTFKTQILNGGYNIISRTLKSGEV